MYRAARFGFSFFNLESWPYAGEGRHVCWHERTRSVGVEDERRTRQGWRRSAAMRGAVRPQTCINYYQFGALIC